MPPAKLADLRFGDFFQWMSTSLSSIGGPPKDGDMITLPDTSSWLIPSWETPASYEQKCCCVLVVDVSLSMQGKPMAELNRGLQEFSSQIMVDTTTANRLEISLVVAGNTTEVFFTHRLIEDVVPIPEIKPNGSARIVDGIRQGIEIVRERKQYYIDTGQKYYRPWIIVMTARALDEDQDIDGVGYEIRAAVDCKEFFFFALGVGDANMKVLQQMSHPDMAPAKLAGLRFNEFFQWPNSSVPIFGKSPIENLVSLPDTSSWLQDGLFID